MTTTYDVRVLGHLWMPHAVAATQLTIQPEQLAEYPRADGESDNDYEARMVQCGAYTELGDFSGVDAWEITRVEVSSDSETWTHPEKPNVRREINQRETTYTVLVKFTDDEEITWTDCTYGGGEFD